VLNVIVGRDEDYHSTYTSSSSLMVDDGPIISHHYYRPIILTHYSPAIIFY
jgi:hypothetical protein